MVVSLARDRVTGAWCGAHHSLLLVESSGDGGEGGNGGLYAAGWCLSGQLGVGIATDEPCCEFQGVLMPQGTRVVSASGGYGHSCALTANGEASVSASARRNRTPKQKGEVLALLPGVGGVQQVAVSEG